MKIKAVLLTGLAFFSSAAFAGHHEKSSVEGFIEDASEKVFDYKVIKATGWAYSKMIKTTVLDEGENSAVVLVDFTRHKADDSIISTSKVFYTLSMTDEGWKLVGASIPGGITLVE